MKKPTGLPENLILYIFMVKKATYNLSFVKSIL